MSELKLKMSFTHAGDIVSTTSCYQPEARDFSPNIEPNMTSSAKTSQPSLSKNTHGQNSNSGLTDKTQHDRPGVMRTSKYKIYQNGCSPSPTAHNVVNNNKSNNNNNNNYEQYNHNVLPVLTGLSAAVAASNLSLLSSDVSTPDLLCRPPTRNVKSAPTNTRIGPRIIGRCTPLKPPKKYRTDGDGCEILRCKRSLNFGGQRKPASSSVDDKKKDAMPDVGSSPSNQETGRPRESIEKRNQRERKRVKQINTTFVTLQNHLPSFCWDHRPGSGPNGSSSSAGRNYKPSKVDTLRTAIDYIRSLQELVAEHDALVSAQCLSLLQSVNEEEGTKQECFYTVKNNISFTSDDRNESVNYCRVSSSTGTVYNDSFYDVMICDDVTRPDDDDACNGSRMNKTIARNNPNNPPDGNLEKSFAKQCDSFSFIDFESWIA